MAKFVPWQPAPIILKIASDSIRNENKEILLFKDTLKGLNDKKLIKEVKLKNSLCYEIGPAKPNTLKNTVNDLLSHFELAKEITKAADNVK